MIGLTEDFSVPALRFREFSDNWDLMKLGEFLTFRNGINADKQQYGAGYKFINVMDIISSEPISHDNIIGRVDVSKEVFNKSEVTFGDILFQRSSETRAEVGQSNVYLDKKKSATFGGFVIRGKSRGNYHPVFMNYLLKTSLVRKEITARSGGSTRYNVGQVTLESTPVFITSSDDEQQKIANFLTSADTKIQQLKRKHTLMQQYKKGLMQQLFNQQVRFKDDTGQDYPDWSVKKLGDILTFFPTNSFSRSLLNYDSGPVRNIHYGDIHTKFQTGFKLSNEKVPYVNSGVDLSKINQDSYCREGDVIIADASEDYKDVGKAIQIMDLNNQKVLAGLHTYLGRDIDGTAVIGFMGYLLQTSEVRSQIMKLATGVSVLGISKGNIGTVSLRLPESKEEQKKIVGLLEAIDNKIQGIHSQIVQAESFKNGLLQQMFV